MSASTLQSQINETKADILRLYDELKNMHIKYYTQLSQQLEVENDIVNDITTRPKKSPEPIRRYPERTKIKWILNDNTYRVAIVTRKYILQVKSVTDGILEVDKESPHRKTSPKLIAFDNDSLWRKSLPPGGDIVITEPY